MAEGGLQDRQNDIDRFLAEHGITVVEPGRRGVPARRVTKSVDRKLGERWGNGRLKYRPTPDAGPHVLTLLHRAEAVEPKIAASLRTAIEFGTALDIRAPADLRAKAAQDLSFAMHQVSAARDQRAGYVIGQLAMTGKLADPHLPKDGKHAAEQTERRHDTAIKFAKTHFWLFGPGTAPSHLKNLLTGFNLPSPDAADGSDDKSELAWRYGTWVKRAITAGGFRVLERAAIYEVAPASMSEEHLLRRTLDAVAGERPMSAAEHPIAPVPDAVKGNPVANDNTPPAKSRRTRPSRLEPSFLSMRPGKLEIAAAVERMKLARVANDNEPANENEPAREAIAL